MIEMIEMIKSLRKGEFLEFHLDFGNEIQNVAVYRTNGKLKYAADCRVYRDGHWMLCSEENGTCNSAVLNWVASMDADCMHPGWCNVDCDF